jgi:hypothetical protein
MRKYLPRLVFLSSMTLADFSIFHILLRAIFARCFSLWQLPRISGVSMPKDADADIFAQYS